MSPVPLLAGITDAILHLHGWAALALVFALPALEASAFVGFVFPGEIAVLLGGVLAYQGRISLGAAVAAAILGAVIGDSAGYLIGRRWGGPSFEAPSGSCPSSVATSTRTWTGPRSTSADVGPTPWSSADSPLGCESWCRASPACRRCTTGASSCST